MMYRAHWLGLLLATAALPASPSLAQDAATRPAPEPSRTIDESIEQLGADEYSVRKAASVRLQELGDAARADLQHAVEDHDDPEVRMRALRILRKLEVAAAPRDDSRRLRRRVALRPDAPRFDDSRDPRLGRVRDMIDRMLDERMPSHEEILERVFEDMRGGRADARFPRFEQHFFDMDDDGQDDGQRSRESVRIEVGDDGVRVEVESGEGSDSDAKVYEAPDLEAFRAQHPEIARRYLGRGSSGFGLRVDGPSPFLQWRVPQRADARMPEGFGLELRPPATIVDGDAPPQNQRLGVVVEALHPAVADFLGFEPGTGLRVERVVEGSLADSLELRVGDVLMRVGDQRIESRADVAEALAGVEAGREVVVVVNRRGHEVDRTARKLADAPGDEAEDASSGRDDDESALEHDADEQESVLRKR